MFSFDYSGNTYTYEKSPYELLEFAHASGGNFLATDNAVAQYNSPYDINNNRSLTFNVTGRSGGKLDPKFNSTLQNLFVSYFPDIPYSSVSFYGYNGSYGSSPYRLSSVILSSYYSPSSPNDVVSLDFRSSYDNYGHSVSLTFRAYLQGNPIPVYGTLPVPDNYIPIDFIDNFAPPAFDGSDLGLIGDISDLGQTLLVSGFNFSEFLNYKVGGASILSLIIGSGIFIYMGWCVVKWFLPT